MYPEDRVLVAYVPKSKDFALIREEQWYRIPVQYAPKGLFAEYIAFYFGSSFGTQKWAIHYFARNLGHELTTRRDLIPDEPDHARVDELYYKIQLGPLQERQEPIVSLRWRRLTFVHTTWDRFVDAREINDLFLDGDPFVNRLYATLKDRGIHAERSYHVNEPEAGYLVPLAIPCQNGIIQITDDQIPTSEAELPAFTEAVVSRVAAAGGIRRPQ